MVGQVAAPVVTADVVAVVEGGAVLADAAVVVDGEDVELAL
jgi:hypothetical protein